MKNCNMKKLWKPIEFLFGLILLLGCSGDSVVDEMNNTILVNSIIINGSNITDGKPKQLSVVVLPNNATNRAVTWGVSNESVALISNTGLLNPIENGTVKVTASAQDGSGVSAEKTIIISGVAAPPVLVESISIVGGDITDGSAQQLSVEVLPADATNKVVTWAVSNTAIASITSEGLLTPKTNGTVTITATAIDGSGVKGTLEINISGVVLTNLRAENMLLWQRNNGGWPKEPYNDFSGYDREQTEQEIATANSTKNNTDTTIDNNHTVGEIRALLSAYKGTNNTNYLDGAERGIQYLFTAQYDNGGWPQYYPLRNNYSRYITYNDNAMSNVMGLMWDIYKKQNNAELVNSSYIDLAKTAFDKGIDVMLQSQLTFNGKKAVWCAQHDEVTLAAAPARSYELESFSGSESVGVVRTLMLVEQPSQEIIDAITSAVDWFNSSKIVGYNTQKQTVTDPSCPDGYDVVLVEDPGHVMWARFYDLDTNIPFFCGRDGIKKSTLAEIECERRAGYAWYGSWPSNLIGTEYNNWKAKNGL